MSTAPGHLDTPHLGVLPCPDESGGAGRYLMFPLPLPHSRFLPPDLSSQGPAPVPVPTTYLPTYLTLVSGTEYCALRKVDIDIEFTLEPLPSGSIKWAWHRYRSRPTPHNPHPSPSSLALPDHLTGGNPARCCYLDPGYPSRPVMSAPGSRRGADELYRLVCSFYWCWCCWCCP